MILGTMIMALPLLAVAPQPDGCFALSDDRIYARDMVAAAPVFASVAADFSLGYSPAPGTKRFFKGDALKKLALNQGVAAELLDAVPDVCFERAMATLTAEEVLQAMR